MPALTGADLAAIRTRPIERQLTFYLYQPATIWTGTVGGAPSRGDRALTVATVTGDPANILADSTVWITDSSDDPKVYPSKVRFRSYSAPTMTVADNDIDWANGDKLTAVRLFEIWPRIVYIDPADGTQYKDRDVAYVDDDTAQPPKANAGPAAIVDLPSGGTVDIVFRDEDSFSVPSGGAVASYLFDAHGGSPAVVAGAEASSTVTYRYSTAGFYYVSLTVTDANGKTDIRYVPVIVDDGTLGVPYTTPNSRAWNNNGWVLGRRLMGLKINQDLWYDGAPCFLTADDVQVADTAFVDNRSNLRFSGWLIEDRTRRTYYRREVSYRAVSSAHILSQVPAFPIGFRDDVAPTSWYELSDLSLDSVCCQLLRWHTTAHLVCDFQPTGEWLTRNRPGENCRADNVLSQIDDVLHACFANLRCDRQGILRAMREVWHLSSAERLARGTIMTLQNSDFSSVEYGPRRHRAVVSQVRLLGVDGSGTPYISASPGDAPLDGGRPGEVQKLAPKTQAELNQWAGQELAYVNFRQPVRLQMTNEMDVVDPALGELLAGTLSSFDENIPDGSYSIVGVRFEDNQRGRYTLSEWTLLPFPGVGAGQTRAVPIEPDPPDPPPPIDDPPPPLPDPPGWPTEVVVATVERGVYFTDSFTGTDSIIQPTWSEINDDLPTFIADGGDWEVISFAIDRHDRANRWFVIIEDTTVADHQGRELWRYETTAGGGDDTWDLLIDQAALQGGGYTSDNDARMTDICCDPISGDVFIHANTSDQAPTGLWGFWVLRSTTDGDSWSTYTMNHATLQGFKAGAYWENTIQAYNSVVTVSLHHTAGIGQNQVIAWSNSSGQAGTWNLSDNLAGSNWTPTVAINPLDGYYFKAPGISVPNERICDVNNNNGAVTQRESTGLWDSESMDAMRFSPVNQQTQWIVYQTGVNTYLCETANNWMSYLQSGIFSPDVKYICEWVGGDEDMIIIATDDLAGQDHTILVSYSYADTTPDGKAGNNAGGAPFSGSIPNDSAGVCQHGVWVIA